MSINKDLFTEKFRPKKLEQLITRDIVRKELSKGLVQNLLFSGNPGTGKSSALFILAQPHTYLYINASSERGIDTIREKISNFCSTISLDGGKERLKCVILDEIDGGTPDFFSSLRAVMERYADTSRFIASCNYIQKIPDPIQSRFNVISFDATNKEEEKKLIVQYENRIKRILDALKINNTPDVLTRFVMNDFPDMRTLMNKLQSFQLQGITDLDERYFNINFDFADLFKVCAGAPDKPYENYKFVMGNYSSKVDESLVSLGTDFPEYLRSNHPTKLQKLPLVMIAIAEYQYQKAFTLDPVITLLATMYKIQTILQ